MSLVSIYSQLADIFNGPEDIEYHAGAGLRAASESAVFRGDAIALPQPFVDVMLDSEAHPLCKLIAQTPLPWAPPETSNDKTYVKHSTCKAHVELIGPGGLAKSNTLRLGLYGMLPNSEYGIRTHPAEEIYIMLAGQAYWKRAEAPYTIHSTGERSYHPSMMEHGTKTGDRAFMSVYAWYGDISTESYVYFGKSTA